jgi:acetylornithine deacetylase/succinyl-diaminopimelate desuccinylase-like protein
MEERIVELTSALVAIPTHETEQDAQELLASWLEACGFSCELQEIVPKRPNLIARRGSGGRFLCSHADVHRPHDHPDPFTSRRQGDLLVGRGVLDAKGQIAALVAALEATPEADALVVITCDEESGGLGSERASIPDGPWFEDGGIVLEPTAFRICTAQAGHIDVKVGVSGTPSHAYAPDPAGSPITAVLAVIEELDTCTFLKTGHPLLPRPRMNVGRIDGGEHVWRTPARASLELTLGVVPGTDLETAVADVRSRLDEVARRWGERGTSFLYEIVDSSDAIEVSLDRVPIASRLADAVGVPFEPAGMPSWTDAGNLLTKHDLPCVVFGAGDLSSAHSNHESVAVAELVRLSEILGKLLRNDGTAR